MVKTIRVSALLVCLSGVFLAACANKALPVAPAAASATPSCGNSTLLSSGMLARSVAPGRWVTIQEVAAGLPKAPIDVGFDIDDTLIFPSPSFQAVLHSTDGPGGSNPYGADMRAVVSNPRSWHDLHHQHDRYVLPKQAGRALLDLHKNRGDRIHLITARVGVEGAQLEARMRQMFELELAGPTVFTGLKSKTEVIRARNLAVYYGDSDSDIEYAQAAGVRGVRVLRASNAIDYDKRPCFGKFGEDVIIDSDR
jgi:acid phosphatase (class B)